ncbi:MAG: hypothetical protein GY777_15095 [Candidatus Brocadiaceae bacterium]|nr:hypothetical protein [Candidatus Brocadiaceae bacterium]
MLFIDARHIFRQITRAVRDFNSEQLNSRSKKVPEVTFIRYGDVLINSTGVGTLGRVSQVLFEPENITIDTHVTIVRPKKEIPVEFWGAHMEVNQKYFESLGEGATGQTELKRQLVNETKTLLPSSELIGNFSENVRAARKQIPVSLEKNENLKKQRDMLLPKRGFNSEVQRMKYQIYPTEAIQG